MTAMNRVRASKGLRICLALLLPLSSGCQHGLTRYFYLGKPKPQLEQYRENAMEEDHPGVAQAMPLQLETTAPPRTVATIRRDEIWDLSLEEAVHIALANSDVIRSAGQFLSPGNTLLANPLQVASTFDPAIQDSGVLFGGVGTEAALAEFDATLSSSLFFSRDETVSNSAFTGTQTGRVLEQETGQFNAAINKQMAYGAQFTLSHQVNYLDTNSTAVLFPSSYSGNVQAEYRQQLLSGSGAEFVRVAGPLSTGFTNITGVSNGVLIARINADISITEFEANVRNLVKDVEDTYWDLYLSYRNFDTSVTARNTALDTWRVAKAKRDLGGVRGFSNSEEAQARDRYFETRAQAENALGNLYVTEQRLRELLALPINDCKVIRPADDPVAARLHAEWYHSLAEALTERVELRRQKWNIKSLELQLGAAKNFARPRLDLVARYRVNGFGDHLLANSDDDRFGGDLNSFYDKVAEGEETGYDLGLEFNMPFGLRLAKTQVQNIELRLAKARKVLAAQELEIGHELAVAFQQLETSYSTAVSNFSRRNAALERVRMIGQELEVGSGSNTLDRYLRAQESLAAAENAYHQSLVDYNKAIVNLHFRQGTLLQHDSIQLAEGKWDPEAYQQAYAKAKSRAHAIPAPHKRTVPPAFAADGHIQKYDFTSPEARGLSSQDQLDQEIELAPYPERLPLPFAPDQMDKSNENGSDVPQIPGETPDSEPSPPPYFEKKDGKPQLIEPVPTDGREVRNDSKAPAFPTAGFTPSGAFPVQNPETFPATSGGVSPAGYTPTAGTAKLPELIQNPVEQPSGPLDLKNQFPVSDDQFPAPGSPWQSNDNTPSAPAQAPGFPEQDVNSTPVPASESTPATRPLATPVAREIGNAIPSYNNK